MKNKLEEVVPTLEMCIQNIQEFAIKNKVIFEDEGKCGFGRECVGLLNGDSWVSYNPTHPETYEYLKEYYDERLCNITPPNAHHKHNCIAVLGRGEEAIRQLSDWVTELKKLNAIVVRYPTEATGIALLLQGIYKYTIKIQNNEKT